MLEKELDRPAIYNIKLHVRNLKVIDLHDVEILFNGDIIWNEGSI
jgi:hypothetical protein